MNLKWWGLLIILTVVALLGGICGYHLKTDKPIPKPVAGVDTTQRHESKIDSIKIVRIPAPYPKIVYDTVYVESTPEIKVSIKDSVVRSDIAFAPAPYFDWGMITYTKEPIEFIGDPKPWYRYNSNFTELLNNQWQSGYSDGLKNCKTPFLIGLKYFGIGLGTGLAVYGISQMF